MKRVLIGLVAAAVLPVAGALAQTAAFPSKPLKIIVPFAPSGPNDIIARLVGQKLNELWGHPTVIENRGGAGGTIGVELAAKAPADGYTLVMGGSSSLAVAPGLYPKLAYDPLRDLTAISNVAFVPYAVAVNPHVPAKNVRELIAASKTLKGGLTFGSSGSGSMSHLAAELFRLKAGIPLLHVPYKGGGPALAAVASGETQLSFPSPIPVAPHVKSGRVRALGFTGDTRVSSLPDVPTIAEAGLPGFKFDAGWHAWFAPARTPPAIINRVYAEIKRALDDPKLREAFVTGGYEPKGDTPVEFQKTFRTDIKRYAEIVKAAKIEAQ